MNWKEKLIKVLKITLGVILFAGFCVTLGFVEKKQQAAVCKGLDINIDVQNENFFVGKEDIISLLNNRRDSIIGQPVKTVNVPALEKLINAQSPVANAEVYMTGNGILKVEVKQRRPLVRIYNKDEESYYIDDAGKLMPLSDNYTARVLVVNGYIMEPYSKRYMYNMDAINKNEFAKAHSLLDDVYALASYVDKDEFWKAQVQQLYINEKQEIESRELETG